MCDCYKEVNSFDAAEVCACSLQIVNPEVLPWMVQLAF